MMTYIFAYLCYMEELLNNGLINLAALARQLWPDKDPKTAANTLRAKINKNGFNKLSSKESAHIWKVIKDFSDELTIKGVKNL